MRDETQSVPGGTPPLKGAGGGDRSNEVQQDLSELVGDGQPAGPLELGDGQRDSGDKAGQGG